MSTPQSLPEQFGRYRIVRKLGAGGMGAVYLAEDRHLDCRIALKVSHFGADESEAIQRFQREAELAQRIHHPFICPVYESGQIDGLHYLTMLLVEGTPLNSLIGPEEPWQPSRAAALIRRLALALQALHDKKVIHRDLKPHNVMVRANDEPMLMDFGLARSLGVTQPRLTRTGSPVGTPVYMPPEQVNGDSTQIGPATDVYSLGVILYECLTGLPPFDADNLMALFYQVLNVPPPPPCSRRPGLDPELEAVCLKALAKKPTDRFASMAAFADALEEYLRKHPVPPAARDQGSPSGGTGKQEQILPSLAPTRTTGELIHPDEMMRVECPECGKALRTQAERLGKRARCPGCGAGFIVGAAPAPRLPREIVNSIDMKLVLIPAGTFLMGSPKEEQAYIRKHYGKDAGNWADQEFQHEVEITRPFYMSIYQVTQEEYQRVMGNNPSHFTKVKGEDTRRFPVEQVSWDDAVEFCGKLSEMAEEKKTGRPYRLPTEAEWECACRGGATSSTPFFFGNSLSSTQANFDGNVPYEGAPKGPDLQRTTTVGSYHPNGFGLFDMHGNVWEWCQDWHNENYYNQSPRQDPQGPQRGNLRVLRGGSWSSYGRGCRSARRNGGVPDSRYYYIGFRVVCLAPRTS